MNSYYYMLIWEKNIISILNSYNTREDQLETFFNSLPVKLLKRFCPIIIYSSEFLMFGGMGHFFAILGILKINWFIYYELFI